MRKCCGTGSCNGLHLFNSQSCWARLRRQLVHAWSVPKQVVQSRIAAPIGAARKHHAYDLQGYSLCWNEERILFWTEWEHGWDAKKVMQSYAIIGHLCLGRQSTAVCGYSRKGLTESKPLVDMADCVIGVWQFSPDVKTGKIQTLLSGLAWKPPRISSSLEV